MTSTPKIIANRKNALKSTGPRTPHGKAIVARNALKHGLLSRQVLLPDESESAWKKFHRRLLLQLAPLNDLETFLAERVIAHAWRLYRLLRIESEVMLDDLQRLNHPWPRKIFSHLDDQPQNLGSAIACNLRGPDVYSKLRRYETGIERALFKNLHELQRLQAARFGRQVPLFVI